MFAAWRYASLSMEWRDSHEARQKADQTMESRLAGYADSPKGIPGTAAHFHSGSGRRRDCLRRDRKLCRGAGTKSYGSHLYCPHFGVLTAGGGVSQTFWAANISLSDAADRHHYPRAGAG